MKCNVCGNEIDSNATKCSVCGTVFDKTASLKSAISNISTLANALRVKREETAETDSRDKEEIKKVHTIDELYSKDINLEPTDEEYREDFDLNAFYQNSENMIEQEEEELDDEVEESSEETGTENSEEDIEDESEELVVSEDESEEELGEDGLEKRLEEVTDTVEEPEKEEGITIDYEEESISSHDQYIKESDIQHYDDAIDGEEEDENNSDDLKIEFEEIPQSAVSEVTQSDQEENIDAPAEEVSSITIEEDSSPIAFDETTEGIDGNTERPEDIPFTQLDEVNSSVSNDHPIVVADKDVVSLDGNTDSNNQNAPAGSPKERPEKVKYNKFCGVMAIILIILGTIAGAVVILNHFVLDSLPANVVFDFVKEFLTNPDYLMYVVLGSIATFVLALIFSIIQVFIKPRKMGKVVMILTILFAAGICVGYYFANNLLFAAIDYVKSMIM